MEGKTNGLQIAGFVVSLVSCFIFGFYGLAGITAWFFLLSDVLRRSKMVVKPVLELLALY